MLSDERKFGWVWVSALQKFIHPSAHAVYLRVLEELEDQREGLLHHTRAGYKRGCRGPLCMKAMRDYGRQYQRKRAGQVYQGGTRTSQQRLNDELLNLFRPTAREEEKV